MDILLLVFQIKLGLKKEKVSIKKDLSILDVAVLVGFNSQNYYSMVFKKFNNLTPIEYKNIYN
ncbi:AraC family transcriptional regulator [Clostridioides difficile]|nr:AraC family transcriptional regulator [Clostridioides difficile]